MTTTTTNRAVATLGGGCFWCLEPVFRDLRGVDSVVSGYAGGHVPNPTYEQVCGKKTGHAEVVQITFDPTQISFRDLLAVFFDVHDPTTVDQQGNDYGPQYRSVILYHSAEQKADAEAVIADLNARRAFPRPIVTQVVPASEFYTAEAYHQEYFDRNPNAGYCRIIIAPKVAKFRKSYKEKLATAGTR